MGQTSALPLKVFVLFALWAASATAQSVIFKNGLPNHNSEANNITFFIGAEDFTLPSTQTITAGRIWVYGPGYSGSIHWTIYANASNQPGNKLASNTSKATLTATGVVNAEGFAEYIVDFSIDPFTATAGTTYWLGVQDAIPNPTVFPPSVIPFNWEWTNPNATLTSWFYGYGCCGAPTGWYELNYSSSGSNQGAEHAFELFGNACPALDSILVSPMVNPNDRSQLFAQFVPKIGGSVVSLATALAACGFDGFDWVQTIDQWPGPNQGALFATFNPSVPLVPVFADPPKGGYTYQVADPLLPQYQPNFADANPFYYSPFDITSTSGTCAMVVITPSTNFCNIPMSNSNSLNFYDAPTDSCLPGGKFANSAADCAAPLMGLTQAKPPFISFTTQLVGYHDCALSSPGCNSQGFMPTGPLFQWQWLSDWNGSPCPASTPCGNGGIFGISSSNIYAPDPSSGTGGVTITSINGVQQIPPSVTCTATPATLWPPNGKAVLVTVSGNITPGTSLLSGTSYAVTDKYGQVQPSGTIALSAGGSYSFGVSLIAARNGNDKNGRTYTIITSAPDRVGNVGSCSAVVTVPHDQGN